MEHFLAHLIFGWLRKGRRADAALSPDGKTHLLTYSKRYKFLANFALIVVVGLGAVFAYVGELNLGLGAVLGFWGCVAILGFISAYRTIAYFDDECLTFITVFFGRRHIAWEDIDAVGFKPKLSAILVTPSAGKARRIPIYADGLTALRDALSENAPHVLGPEAFRAMTV
jgi:hypothetical protein